MFTKHMNRIWIHSLCARLDYVFSGLFLLMFLKYFTYNKNIEVSFHADTRLRLFCLFMKGNSLVVHGHIKVKDIYSSNIPYRS